MVYIVVVPAVGYTLRATLDPVRNQIYLLTVIQFAHIMLVVVMINVRG